MNIRKSSSALIVLVMALASCSPVAVATVAPYSAPISAVNPETYLSPADPSAVQGGEVSYDPAAGFYFYGNNSLGISLSIPNSWFVVESPEGGFSIYPDFVTEPNLPSPSITFSHAEYPSGSSGTILDTGDTIRVLTIPTVYGATLEGITYRDLEFTLPVQNTYVEFTQGTGKLLITATYGPYYNLEPALINLLSTLTFY